MAMNASKIMLASSRLVYAPSSSVASVSVNCLRSSSAAIASTTASSRVGVADDANIAPAFQRRHYQFSLSRHPVASSNQYNSNNTYHQQKRYFARSKRHNPPRHKNNGGYDDYSFDDLDATSPPPENKNILVIGSSGVLGKTIVSHFGNKHSWNVLGADVLPQEEKKPRGLADYIKLSSDGNMSDLTGELYRGVSNTLHADTTTNKLDAVVVASGGWAGDIDIADMMERHLADVNSSELEDVDVEEEYARQSAEVCERMMRMNYYPVVAGSQVGKRFIKRGGKKRCTL